ncbi:nitrogen fixation protein NifQ [Rhodopseudomonas sp. P2A-2r]|uniref:nitrogen fixation protein NifQ n=1 Tax=unclassified Rhodopseudomonas TaxID=2638247 RepID=UPI0039B6F618
MMVAPQEILIEAPPVRDAAMGEDDNVENLGAATYRMLTGLGSSDALIDDDFNFDKHVLASILAAAASDCGGIAIGAGLATADIVSLLLQWFPDVDAVAVFACRDAVAVEDDETSMVRDLLLTHRSTDGDVSRWLAAMIARRAMEPNHLWEDLGLRDRSELTRLLLRHFAPMASRNTQNMRWKRFFYRMLCEQDGFVMCTTPVCTDCSDFDICFGDETGESRMADRRRESSLQASASQAASLSL